MMTKEEHLLVILMEEAAEIQHIASKCLRFGMLNSYGEGHPTNHFRLIGELLDMKAVVQMLEEHGTITLPHVGERGNAIEFAVETKKRKVEDYMKVSQVENCLEDDVLTTRDRKFACVY